MLEIREKAHRYILENFLPGENASALTGATPLISSGIIDSVAVLRLIAYLEKEFGVVIEPDDAPRLETVDGIVTVVETARRA